MTKIQIEPKWSEVKPSGHYVYIHRRLSDQVPFYVGKGSGKRAWNLSGRSKLWHETATSFGIFVEIKSIWLTADEAYVDERKTILKLRGGGVFLTNLSDGGHGSRGHCRKEYEVKVYCSNGMEFESIKSAEQWLIGIGVSKASNSAITACCKGKRYMAYGFAWSYDMTPDHPAISHQEYAKKRSREERGVSVYNSDGNKYSSISEAVEAMRDDGYLKAGHASIIACIKGKYKAAYGRAWSYDGVPKIPDVILKRPKVQRSKSD